MQTGVMSLDAASPLRRPLTICSNTRLRQQVFSFLLGISGVMDSRRPLSAIGCSVCRREKVDDEDYIIDNMPALIGCNTV